MADSTNPAVAQAVTQAVNSLKFKGVSAAAKWLSAEKGIDLMNARDCIYKSLRTGKNGKAGKTHGYETARGADGKEVILTAVKPE